VLLTKLHMWVWPCRVVRAGASSPWQQTVAVPSGTPGCDACSWHQELQPVSDPLINRCLRAYGKLAEQRQHQQAAQQPGQAGSTAAGSGKGSRSLVQRLLDFAAGVDNEAEQQEQVAWLPTACLALLDCIAAARPSHTLLAADFDALPQVQLEGVNAPLVSAKVGGLQAWGCACVYVCVADGGCTVSAVPHVCCDWLQRGCCREVWALRCQEEFISRLWP
jgi:hypothetical protein